MLPCVCACAYTAQLKLHRQQGLYKRLPFPLENCWLKSEIFQENIFPHIWTLYIGGLELCSGALSGGTGCSISWSCKDVLLHCDSFRDPASVCKHWILSFLWWMLDLNVRVNAVNWTKKWSPLEATVRGSAPSLLEARELCREEYESFSLSLLPVRIFARFFYFPSKSHNNAWKKGIYVSHCSTLQSSDFPKCFCWLQIAPRLFAGTLGSSPCCPQRLQCTWPTVTWGVPRARLRSWTGLGKNVCKNQAFPRGLPSVSMEGQCHAQNFFDSKVFEVSSQLEEGKPLGIACYDTAFSYCSRMPWLSVLLNGFHLPICFNCDSGCGSVNAASDKNQGQWVCWDTCNHVRLSKILPWIQTLCLNLQIMLNSFAKILT